MPISTTLDRSSPSNFALVFPKLPSETTLAATDELTLAIHTTIIPSLNLDLIEQRFMGATTQRASGQITFEPWNISFIVDSEFKNWKALHDWVTFINNAKDDFIEKHGDYAVDATLRVLDNFQAAVFELYFVSVWPTNLGEISLSYREGEQVLESSATFSYDRFEQRAAQ